MKIPKKKYAWDRLTNEDRAARQELENYAASLLDNLHPEWRNYVSFGWTRESLFTVQEGTSYKGKSLARWSDEFSLDKKRADRIKSYIENRIAHWARLTEKYETEKFLKDLIQPLVDKFDSETVDLKLEDGEMLVIRVGTRSERGFFDSSGSVVINRQGEVSAPKAHTSERYYTVADAEQFLAEFRPVHNWLLKLAEQIKAELPKEFLITL